MRKNSPFRKPKQVLVFNRSQVLIAVVRSLHSAKDLSKGNLQSISFSCTGKYISTGGFYFRHIHPDIEIDLTDLGVLKLQDYDGMCGETDRRYHTVREMTRMKKQKELNSKTIKPK